MSYVRYKPRHPKALTIGFLVEMITFFIIVFSLKFPIVEIEDTYYLLFFIDLLIMIFDLQKVE